MIPSPIFSLPLSPLFLSSSLSFLFPFFLALDNLSTFLLALPFFSLPYLLPTPHPLLPPSFHHPESNLDDSLVDEHYPLVADATFVPMLHGEVLTDSDWASPSLHAVVKFSWAVLLRECASRASFSGVCVCVCVLWES